MDKRGNVAEETTAVENAGESAAVETSKAVVANPKPKAQSKTVKKKQPVAQKKSSREVEFKPGRDGKYRCPECGQKFEAARHLGTHRRTQHHISGSSKSATRARELRKEKQSELTCPECQMKLPDAKAYGIHRWKVHGIPGKSRLRGKNQAVRDETTTEVASGAVRTMVRDGKKFLVCPECQKLYTYAAGLGVHRKNVHGVVGTSSAAVYERIRNQAQKALVPVNVTNNLTQQGELTHESTGSAYTGTTINGNAGIPDAAIIYCYAKCEAILDNYAKENGILAVELTRGVAQFLLRAARR